jgi:ABC-type branched-subunit amino acid transport system substrate-binding protein
MMKRILVLVFALLLVFSFSVTSLFADKEEKPDVFKIGFLSSLSGTFAGVAETQKKAFILAVEEVNAKGGLDMPWGKVPVEYIVKDDEAKLDIGVRRFREMVGDGIHALTGGIWNPMSAALNEECKITPVIYIPGYVPAKDMNMKGNPSQCTFTPTFTPWSIGYISGEACINTLDKKKIFYLARADSWGTTIYEGLQAAVKEFGGEIVGYAELPQGTVDYTAVLNKVLSVKPDVFITSMFGGDAIANLKQAYDLGVYDKMTVFNTWTANIVAKGIPADALDGLYALAWFYWNLEGLDDKNVASRVKAYSDKYTVRWNEPPDNMGTAPYVATQVIFQAVQKAGTFDPVKVSEVIAKEKFDVGAGRIGFREDHQAVATHATFLLKGKSAAKKKGDWDFFEVIDSYGGENILPPLAEMGY